MIFATLGAGRLRPDHGQPHLLRHRPRDHLGRRHLHDGPVPDATRPTRVYGDQSAAVLALKAGEVDYLYNSLGLQRGLLDQITGDENLTPIINATNGFRYMAFNMRKDPMAREGFRDALALMIDKEYITGSVLQGVAYPLYATLPEGNIDLVQRREGRRLRGLHQRTWSWTPATTGRRSCRQRRHPGRCVRRRHVHRHRHRGPPPCGRDGAHGGRVLVAGRPGARLPRQRHRPRLGHHARRRSDDRGARPSWPPGPDTTRCGRRSRCSWPRP